MSVITLRSGRTFRANLQILGLSLDPDGELYHGYDGSIDEWDFTPQGPLTDEERQEIAERMIERWRAWAAPPPEASGRGREG
jgi:hypothetical protein